jgi:hypothetical protein
MSLWNRVRARWSTPAPLIGFAFLCTLPWFEINCNNDLDDRIERGTNGAWLRNTDGSPVDPRKTATDVVATQSGLQAAFGSYSDERLRPRFEEPLPSGVFPSPRARSRSNCVTRPGTAAPL